MPEIKVELLGHACAEIICGDTRIVTDPWLKGTAFLGGWQRRYDPPKGWEERLRNATLIYISHSHSDHLSQETLSAAGVTDVVVPRFQSRSAEKAAKACGLRYAAFPMGEWHTVGDARLMILPDTSGRDDSGLLVEYRGKYLINVVDCNMPNGLDLPRESVEWLLAPWSAGASPYPYCYRMPREKLEDIGRRNNAAAISRLKRLITITRPEMYMPFAGFAFATDQTIEEKIQRNDIALAFGVAELVGAEVIRPALKNTECLEMRWVLSPKPPHVDEYFRWTKYKGPRRVYLNNEGFSFSENDSSVTHIEAPRHILNHVLYHGTPWDEMLIGYHCSLWRSPDVYEEDFWEHMQNGLPEERPWAIPSLTP